MATELQVLPEPHLLTSSRLITVAKWHFDSCSPTLLDRSRDGELDLEKCWHLRERFSQSCDVIHLCVCHTLRFDSSALFFFSFSWNVRSSLDCSNHSHPPTHTHSQESTRRSLSAMCCMLLFSVLETHSAWCFCSNFYSPPSHHLPILCISEQSFRAWHVLLARTHTRT